MPFLFGCLFLRTWGFQISDKRNILYDREKRPQWIYWTKVYGGKWRKKYGTLPTVDNRHMQRYTFILFAVRKIGSIFFNLLALEWFILHKNTMKNSDLASETYRTVPKHKMTHKTSWRHCLIGTQSSCRPVQFRSATKPAAFSEANRENPIHICTDHSSHSFTMHSVLLID